MTSMRVCAKHEEAYRDGEHCKWCEPASYDEPVFAAQDDAYAKWSDRVDQAIADAFMPPRITEDIQPTMSWDRAAWMMALGSITPERVAKEFGLPSAPVVTRDADGHATIRYVLPAHVDCVDISFELSF